MASAVAEIIDESTKLALPEIDQDSLLILDRYRVMNVLGMGGMGTVYRAYHVSLQRYVAIKTLRPDYINKRPGLVSRFLREMAAIGQLDHQNIVRATDAGETNGVLHLVMDYLPGSDLGQIASEYRSLRLADVCEMIRQAAVGLHYIHRTMIHRDIKPSNLMLTEGGIVKILDLGLARLHDWGNELTPQGCAIGTHDYMAPEQASGDTGIDARADIYSLGCTLFRMLTGHVPYGGTEYATSARKLLAHQQIPLNEVEGFAEIPLELQEILLLMTAKKPAERYSDAGKVATALAPFARGHNLTALAENSSCVEVGMPLMDSHREELARLTREAISTKRSHGVLPIEETPTVALMPTVPEPVTRLSGQYFKVGTVGVVLAGIVVALYFLFTGPTGANRARLIDPSPADLALVDALEGDKPFESLDELTPSTFHHLLKRKPISLTGVETGVRAWEHRKDAELVELKHSELLLLQTGRTNCPQYKLETMIAQEPWSGQVGVFWGFREFPDAATLKLNHQKYASFHCLYLERKKEQLSIIHATISLFMNDAGGLGWSQKFKGEHVLPALDDKPKAMAVEIVNDRIANASFANIPLTNITRYEKFPVPVGEPFGGGVGIYSYGHRASFDNFRFMPLAKP